MTANAVDLALALALAVCALRGYWRGFFRECFGLLAVIGGIGAAIQFGSAAAAALQARFALPPAIAAGVAFVGIFVVVHTVVNLIGALLDRLASALFLRGINRLAGAAFAVGKGAAVLAFVLLFLHLFPIVPALDEDIMHSAIARPLLAVASNVARAGLGTGDHPAAPDKT